MAKEEIVVSIIVAIISSGVINTLISNYLYKKRLDEDQKRKVGELLDDKILTALLETRNVALMLKPIEILNAKEILDDGNEPLNLFQGKVIYQEVMHSRETLQSFMDKICLCRKEYENFLSVEIALNLCFIERYVGNLLIYSRKFESEEIIRVLGTLFIHDLQDWMREFDKMIVNEINKKTFLLESHETDKWNEKRAEILEKRWEETFLYAIVNNKESKDDDKQAIIQMMQNLLEKLKLKNKN